MEPLTRARGARGAQDPFQCPGPHAAHPETHQKKNNLVRFVCKKQIETSLRGFQFPAKIKHDAMRTHNARRVQETPQHESAQQYMSHSAKWHIATSKLATLFLTDKAIYFVEESIYNNKYHLCHIPVHPFSQHPKLDNQKLHRTGGA